MTISFEPINGDHAIERVSFVLSFDKPFSDEQFRLVRERHSKWADHLPAIREPSAFTFAPDRQQKLQLVQTPALEFAFVRPDDSAVWSFRLMGREAVVECSRYTRWVKIFGVALAHMSRLFDSEILGNHRAVKSTLIVHDAFLASGGAGNMTNLLKKSQLLPEMTLANVNWHVHSGRFVDLSGEKVLDNLNIDSSLRPETVDGSLSDSHRVSLAHVQSIDRSPSIDGSDDLSWFADCMEMFHARNKEILEEILNDAMLEKIGLRRV